MAAQSSGPQREPLAVSFRVGIPGLNTQAQSAQNRLCRFKLVGELLQLEKRLDAREQLGGKDWLIQEIVGPSLDPFDLILAIAETGNEEERDEPGGWILLHLMAEFVARAAGHDHIGKN